MKPALILLLFVFTSLHLRGQHVFTPEAWGGILINAQVSDHWSLWQDMHYVPGNFYLSRSGVTYHHRDRWAVTGGYATVLTSTSFSNQLLRTEHRPWGQAELRLPLSRGWQFRTRFRYDARFRRRVADGLIHNDYIQYHRLRFMAAVRFPISEKVAINVMNESLFNAGRQAPEDALDQTRLFSLIEFPLGPIRLMTGYHIRALPRGWGSLEFRHGFTLWLLYGIDGRGPAAICGECPQ